MDRSKVSDYLDLISATRVVRARVDEIVSIYNGLVPEGSVNSILISEIVDNDGQRVLQNLWLYGEKYACEAKNFMQEDDFDATVAKTVEYWQMKLNEFRPDLPPGPKSRINLRFTMSRGGLFSGGVTGEISGSGDNCPAVVAFFRSFIAPRLGAPEAVS